MLPASGVGARISGSTPEGGHSTPSDFASFVAERLGPLTGRGALAAPVALGRHRLHRLRSGWLPQGPRFSATGVMGDLGGACAIATAGAANNTQDIKSADFIMPGGNGLTARRFRGNSAVFRSSSGFAVTNEREMPHRGHRPPLGQADAAMFGGPVRQPAPMEIPGASRAGGPTRERQFEQAARAALGTDEIDQNEFARMKSSSVASGSGTAVTTYCATTASKNESGRRDFSRPSPRAFRHWKAPASSRGSAPCAASARKYRRRIIWWCANNPTATIRCRRRHRESARRSCRPRRWSTGGRDRTPCRRPDRRPAPSAHKPLRPPRGRYLTPCPALKIIRLRFSARDYFFIRAPLRSAAAVRRLPSLHRSPLHASRWRFE